MGGNSFPQYRLLLEALLVEQLRSQPVDLLGELGAFVDGSSFLLSSALGRVESFPMSLSMLLDVLVLGHLCLLGGRGGGVVGALPASRVRVADCSALPHGRALVRLPSVLAYAMAVATS